MKPEDIKIKSSVIPKIFGFDAMVLSKDTILVIPKHLKSMKKVLRETLEKRSSYHSAYGDRWFFLHEVFHIIHYNKAGLKMIWNVFKSLGKRHDDRKPEMKADKFAEEYSMSSPTEVYNALRSKLNE